MLRDESLTTTHDESNLWSQSEKALKCRSPVSKQSKVANEFPTAWKVKSIKNDLQAEHPTHGATNAISPNQFFKLCNVHTERKRVLHKAELCLLLFDLLVGLG